MLAMRIRPFYYAKYFYRDELSLKKYVLRNAYAHEKAEQCSAFIYSILAVSKSLN